MSLENSVKWIRVKNAVAAGTSDQESASVDMANYEGVCFTVSFGAITANAVTSVKAQQSSDDGSVDTFADLAATGITVADDDDNQLVVLDIYRPRERYVRCVVDRGTQNAVIDGIVAQLYGPRLQPTTHDSATVVAGASLTSPAEGTA